MPTIQTEINRVRDNSNVDWNATGGQYPDSIAILDFNKLLREIGVFSKKNWDIGTGNLVNWQNEYKVDELIGTPNVEILNVTKLYINYWEGLKKAEFTPYGTLDKTGTFNKMFPVYYTKDNSVFIFPTPDADVTGWVEVEASYLLKDYIITDNVEDIPLPRTFLDTIFRFWFEEFIESTVRNNKANAANLRDRYKQEISLAKWLLKSKDDSVKQVQVNPDIYNFLR